MPLFEDETLEGAIRKATAGLGRRAAVARPTHVPDMDFEQKRLVHFGTSHGGARVPYYEPLAAEAGEIRAAFSAANRMLQDGQRQLIRAGRQDSQFQEFFGSPNGPSDAHAELVMQSLASTLNVCSRWNNSNWGIAPQNSGNIIAEVLNDDRIVFYPRFFSDAGGAQRMGADIIHECVHIALNVGDTGYGANAARNLARNNPGAAARSPNNIEQYIRALNGL